MTAAEALTTIDGLRSFTLEGKKLTSDVADIIVGATIERTIEGASTLSVTFHDDKRRLLTSGLLASRVTAQLDNFAFELAQVRKSGDTVEVTFEDLPVAALRRRTEPRKIDAGKMSHVEFSRLLVGEEPWIKFRPPQKLGPQPKTKIELARGNPDDKEAEREDTWATIGRIADERGWRRFIREGQLWYMPETYLFARPIAYEIRENTDGVDEVDFDYDIGKRVAEATVIARAGRWAVPVGSVVNINGLGPANGRWLVRSISRSLFELEMTITLAKPQPTLPEPEPPPAPSAEELGPEGVRSPSGGSRSSGTGAKAKPGVVSSVGYRWPCRGRISSGYGMRKGRLHAGIDIAVPVGTRVAPTRAGTCIFAGSAGGYGYAVYIDHGGVISRYAHLSKIMARRGQRVSVDDVIALSGGARGARGSGNSTGPHLHFEIRPGDRPADPMRFLP